jgi:hypothetical protein
VRGPFSLPTRRRARTCISDGSYAIRAFSFLLLSLSLISLSLFYVHLSISFALNIWFAVAHSRSIPPPLQRQTGGSLPPAMVSDGRRRLAAADAVLAAADAAAAVGDRPQQQAQLRRAGRLYAAQVRARWWPVTAGCLCVLLCDRWCGGVVGGSTPPIVVFTNTLYAAERERESAEVQGGAQDEHDSSSAPPRLVPCGLAG